MGVWKHHQQLQPDLLGWLLRFNYVKKKVRSKALLKSNILKTLVLMPSKKQNKTKKKCPFNVGIKTCMKINNRSVKLYPCQMTDEVVTTQNKWMHKWSELVTTQACNVWSACYVCNPILGDLAAVRNQHTVDEEQPQNVHISWSQLDVQKLSNLQAEDAGCSHITGKDNDGYCATMPLFARHCSTCKTSH